MTRGQDIDPRPAADPDAGDFILARGKSWIVERAERTGPLQTLHLVSCEVSGSHRLLHRRIGDALAGAARSSKPACSPGLQQVFAIDDREIQAKLLCEFVLPLQQHRRWRGDNDHLDPAPQQQLTRNEPSLDGFSQADVIGDYL